MAAALSPHSVEPIDEPEPQPKPITRKEFDSLIEQLMTDAQIRALHPALGDGDSNPAYNRATQRLSNHYNALQKLQDAGITEADPRLAPFRRLRPLPWPHRRSSVKHNACSLTAALPSVGTGALARSGGATLR